MWIQHSIPFVRAWGSMYLQCKRRESSMCRFVVVDVVVKIEIKIRSCQERCQQNWGPALLQFASGRSMGTLHVATFGLDSHPQAGAHGGPPPFDLQKPSPSARTVYSLNST